MAARSKSGRPVRTLVTLGIIVAALFGTVGLGAKFADAAFTPGLALDLMGGTQLILKPVAADGGDKAPDAEALTQAVGIIRQRVDASGVAEAEISTQGQGNIVVGIPGNPTEEDLALVSKSARMTFRTVLRQDTAEAPSPTAWMGRSYVNPSPSITPSEETTDEAPPSESASPSEAASPSESPSPSDSASPSESAAPSESASPSEPASASDLPEPTESESAAPAALPSLDDDFTARLDAALDSESLITQDVEDKYTNLDCSTVGSETSGTVSDDNAVLVTCSENRGTDAQPGYEKYILGPVMVLGSEISRAQNAMQTNQQGQSTGAWAVNLSLKSTGAKQFGDVTAKIVSLTEPQNQFAIVLDDRVITAPRVNSAIPDGNAEITGGFTSASSRSLANQLSFGSLPLNFTVQARDQVSATLGAEALRNGLLAGLIGLILVAVYSFVQYRALGAVTVLSLVFATGITYGALLLLSWAQGYRLSLAGVAGVIVSIGITADSFIVYFERIRDELRDGRSLAQAVDLAWTRARRTILAADAVNFLAAAVLYIVSVGGVRGFAFTLGLTTVMDLVVVMMFTHPVILLLSRRPFWADGHPWSGLDPHRLGAPGSVHYAGRGRVSRVPEVVGDAAKRPVEATGGTAPPPKPVPPGQAGQSIAERKAAAAALTESNQEGGES